MPAKEPEFTVTDRRKFTVEGERRDDAASEDTVSTQQQSAAPPHAEEKANPDAQEEAAEPMPEAPSEAEQHAGRQAYEQSSRQIDDMLKSAGARQGADFQMTFDKLVSSMYMTALIQLGMVHPENEQPRVDIMGARQTIDTLAILQEKTKGNLTESEERVLQSALFELRMAVVEITNHIARSAKNPPPGAGPHKVK